MPIALPNHGLKTSSRPVFHDPLADSPKDDPLRDRWRWVGVLGVAAALLSVATVAAATAVVSVLAGATTLAILLGGIALAPLRAAAQADAERQRQRRTLDRAAMDLAALLIRDAAGTVVFWSAGCRRLLGYAAPDVVGQVAHTVLRTVSAMPRADIDAILLHTGEWEGELRLTGRGGEEVIVTARAILRHDRDGRPLVVESLTDVTALSRTEAAWRQTCVHLTAVVETAADAIIAADADGAIVSINPAGVRMFGYDTAQQLHGQRLDALLPTAGPGRATAAASREQRAVRRDGTVFPVDLSLRASGEESGRFLTAIIRDASARKAAEEALATAENRFQAIFDAQFQFISLIAPDGTVLESNRAILAALGVSREERVGKYIWDAAPMSAAERERLRHDVAQAAMGHFIHREVEHPPDHLGCRWLDLTLTPVRRTPSDPVDWIIAEGRDITEQRTLAEQLSQAQKMQALGQLSGGIAHDFNNILQAVSGAATLIERRVGDDEKCRRLARTAIDAAARGTSITQRLLSFARRGELRVEPLPTRELLDGVREVLAHTLGSHILVETQCQPALPWLLSDRGQLETALLNLGTNARDAMPTGGRLTISAGIADGTDGAPRRAGLAPGAYVRIDLTDTGTGMAAQTLARAVEPFFTTKPPGKGTGLGLAMVKGFVEQSGGAMEIDSAPGRGTRISLWLRQAADAPAREPAAAPAAPPGGAATRLLLVDDDDLVRETLAEQLDALGFAVLVASCGAEALALIESGETPAVLVSDLSMPGINGIDTIRQARTLRPGLCCFLLTGYAGDRAALEAGTMFTLLRKPIAAPALAARVQAALAGVAGVAG